MPTTNEKFVAQGALGGGSTPATTNDGFDRFGWNISGGTFTNATKTLNKTGAWASYTWVEGDRIGITGGTGVTAGSYEIASKTDDDNIVLTEDIGGTNPADVTTSTGAWGDADHSVALQFAADAALAAGTRVNICNEAVWALTVTVDFDTRTGGADGGIVYRGASERGLWTGDALGTARIDASSLGAAVDAFSIGINSWRSTFMDLEITGDPTDPDTTGGGGRYGIAVVAATTSVIGSFIRVRVHHMGDSCVHSGAAGGQLVLKDCELDHSAVDGYEAASAAQGSVIMFGCSLHHNDGNGATLAGSDSWSVLSRCLLYSNGGDGIDTLAAVASCRYLIDHCTIYANTGAGVDIDQTAGVIAHGTLIKDSGGLGVDIPNGNWERVTEARTNLLHNNSGGDFGWDTAEVRSDPFGDNVTQDPLLASVSSGSEQLYPGTGSPAIAASVPQKVR